MLRIKDLLYTYLDYRLRRKWRQSLSDSKIHGEVLMFHHVTNDYVEIIPSCRCPVKVFEHYLDAYARDGYRFVSLVEAYEIISIGKDRRPFCVITFDDIPENVYQNAYPILKSRGIPFTVFVTTKFVDWVNPETGEQYISMEHLKELDRDPLCTVGAHTTTHPILRLSVNVREEMQKNKEWLENKLGHPIDYLAFPYGKHSNVSKKVKKTAKEIGFKCAFSTIEAPITDCSSKQLFFLPRTVKY